MTLSNTTQNFHCECGWKGHEDDLRSECTFHGTREEPSEYEAFCPQCNANWNDMGEAALCIGCEDTIVENEGDTCTDCEEVFRQECRRA